MNRTFGNIKQRAEGDSRKVIFTASTDAKDRHGTILNQNNWQLDNFNRNGIIGYNHEVYGSMFGGSNPDDIIGTGRAWTENGELLVEVDFEPADINEKAEKIFRKVQHGSLKAVSVGFAPVGEGHQGRKADGEDTSAYYFEGQELVELSIVNVPSNPEAVKRSLDESAINYIIENIELLGEDNRGKIADKLNELRAVADAEAEAKAKEESSQVTAALNKLRLQKLNSNGQIK